MPHQLSYDIIPHRDGWAIVITPSHADAFSTRRDAFDAAVDYARKLRFIGYTVQVHVQHKPDVEQRRAS